MLAASPVQIYQDLSSVIWFCEYLLINPDSFASVDPLDNPYSMGAGNPPPALTGRDEQERQYRLLLGRLARGRSEQSMIVWLSLIHI